MDHEYKVSVRWFMVFNPTFNTISVTSWQSVLLVEAVSDGEDILTYFSFRSF